MGLRETESKITDINKGSTNFHYVVYVVVPAIFYTADLRQDNPNFKYKALVLISGPDH
jgi:hypothetical protein